MTMILSVATGVLVVFTLLPLWRNPHWLVRALDFPRLQIALCAILLLLALLTQLDRITPAAWGLVAVTSACLMWQLWWIIPYTRLWPVEVLAANNIHSDRRIRIITANVLMTNRNAAPLIELVKRHRPHILVTLESDRWWQDRLDSLQPEMPYSIKCPLDNLYGMHVYSRLPLDESEITYLIEDDKPSMHALVTMRSGDVVRMHFVHPAPPSPTENAESAERDAELIIVARSVATSRHAVIVTGDLNDVAWSSTTRLFRKISGLLDPRVGRGMFNTFHAHYPFMRWPLDHVFHSDDFTLGAIKRLPPIGSDHFPLYIELAYTPAQAAKQTGLDADADDHERARSIAAKQGGDAKDVPRPGE